MGRILLSLSFSALLAFTIAGPQHPDSDRLAEVARLNALPGRTWTAGINERFRGKPLGYAKRLCGVIPGNRDKLLEAVAKGVVWMSSSEDVKSVVIPDEFDSLTNWPQCAEIIGEIRDQSDCGCCWAFGAATAASDRMCIATNGTIKVPLSAEALCFCAKNWAAKGCLGGDTTTPWDYIRDTGLVTGGLFNSTKGYCSDYSLPHCHHMGPRGNDPYPADGSAGCPKVTESTQPQCPTQCDKTSSRKFADDKYTYNGNPIMYAARDIQPHIMAHGPVEAAFSVYDDFEHYVSGIYQHTGSGKLLGGHAVRIVGWGSENGTDYWKVANSWNPYWGEQGYFRIIRCYPKSDCPLPSGPNCGLEAAVTSSDPKAAWGKKSSVTF